jgi:hypothetical protein
MTINTLAAVVFSCALLTAASCAPTSPWAVGAGGDAPAIATQDDDDVGSDPGIGSDPNWSWSPPSVDPVGDPGPDPDPATRSGADPVGGDAPPLPPRVRPPQSRDAECKAEYENALATCAHMKNEEQRTRCEAILSVSYQNCRQGGQGLVLCNGR